MDICLPTVRSSAASISSHFLLFLAVSGLAEQNANRDYCTEPNSAVRSWVVRVLG